MFSSWNIVLHSAYKTSQNTELSTHANIEPHQKRLTKYFYHYAVL